MYVTPKVKALVEEKVQDCIAACNEHFNRNYEVPHIDYDVRGTTGGYYQSGVVSYNPTLLMENTEEYLERTVPHEVAHYIDEQNGGLQRDDYEMIRWAQARAAGRRVKRPKRDVHGASWQHICRVIGMTDITRCHQYDVANAQVRVKNKFEYKCNGCNTSIFMSSVRHNKMRRGRSLYWCRSCGQGRGTLTLVAALGQRTRAEIAVLREGTRAPTPPRRVVAPVAPTVGGVSSMDRARKLWSMYGQLGRGVFIRKAVECGIKQTTASTYYQSFRSGK